MNYYRLEHYTLPGEFAALENTDFRVKLEEILFPHRKTIAYEELTLDEQWDLALAYLLQLSDADRQELLIEALICDESYDKQRADAVNGFWIMVLSGKNSYFDNMRYAVTEDLTNKMNEFFDFAYEEENNLATSQNIGRDIEREMPQACWSQDLGKSHD
jgi:hypothetical protein